MNINMVKAIELKDIENHWAKENIVRLLTNGKVNGYEDGTFKPDKDVTVLEFIKLLLDTLDIPLVEDGLSKWPDYYIATAQKYQMQYEYNQLLTRYEATDIISKIINLKSVSISKNQLIDLNSPYKNVILKLITLDVVHGYEDFTFRGENHLTRAEAVTMVLRVLEAKEKIILQQKYAINSTYTNVHVSEASNSKINKIRYEIKNHKIYFYDSGRFSHVQNYSIDEKYITNKKLIRLVESLVSENSYTALYYAPSEYIINQIILKYGENEEMVSRNLEYFSLTYYEDKLYDLEKMTLKEMFSNQCYLKITIKKMWKEPYEFENGNYIDEGIKEKLLRALQVEFGKEAEKILENLLTKYIQMVTTKDVIQEQIIVGNKLINIYKTDATSLEFYFEKLSA